MNCRYKIGDVLLGLCVWLGVIAVMVNNALQHHVAWWFGVVALCSAFITGAVLNSNERKREAIQAIRQQRQMALGVPPDEA